MKGEAGKGQNGQERGKVCGISNQAEKSGLFVATININRAQTFDGIYSALHLQCQEQ